VTLVQLREKDLPDAELLSLAREVHRVTRRANVPLVVNDRIDVMLETGAEGVHVGAADTPVAEARRLAGAGIVGATAKSRSQIRAAWRDGADYVGVGPVFASATKPNAGDVLGPRGLAALTADSPLPCVAIGGIEAGNVSQLGNCQLAGVCAVRGILGSPDPREAALAIRSSFPRPA
jgi:thiamine-phosphate diphosphorylase